MKFSDVYIPYGAYWSSPFCKWQGSFANLHPLKFAASVARRALDERQIDPETFRSVVLGTTVPSKGSFYGAPWVAGMIGAEDATGPTINQACATSASVLARAAFGLQADEADDVALCVTADRTSNGPHIYYPNPKGPGGKGESEDWVWDNFNCDPFADNAMIETAENVARKEEISVEEQHDVTLLRYQQYEQALADEGAFHQRFMVTPIEVKPDGRKVVATVEGDEGIYPTTAEGLAGLTPLLPEGTVTFGSQTHPADGNAGMVLTRNPQPDDMSPSPEIRIELISYGEGRAPKGFMPTAPVPAARQALASADLSIEDMSAVKTHNPFAVNDIYFAREMDVELSAMNNYGSSLIWGHPQGPTGMRAVIELIEELVMLGGGFGLFTGCAAGDTAAALVLRVDSD